jgi:hypothetical protein
MAWTLIMKMKSFTGALHGLATVVSSSFAGIHGDPSLRPLKDGRMATNRQARNRVKLSKYRRLGQFVPVCKSRAFKAVGWGGSRKGAGRPAGSISATSERQKSCKSKDHAAMGGFRNFYGDVLSKEGRRFVVTHTRMYEEPPERCGQPTPRLPISLARCRNATKEAMKTTQERLHDMVEKADDYRGFVITWQEPPLTSAKWTANVSSNDPRLFALTKGNAIIDGRTREDLLTTAKQYIDGFLG